MRATVALLALLLIAAPAAAISCTSQNVYATDYNGNTFPAYVSVTCSGAPVLTWAPVQASGYSVERAPVGQPTAEVMSTYDPQFTDELLDIVWSLPFPIVTPQLVSGATYCYRVRPYRVTRSLIDFTAPQGRAFLPYVDLGGTTTLCVVA